MKKLDRDFYLRDTVTVAKELLGKHLTHVVDGVALTVRITETEAYTGVNDKACHSYGGRRTSRTEVMYGEGGYSYIYLIYGIYHLLNVVTEPAGNPCAVLIRCAQVVDGHDVVARRRSSKDFADLTPRQQRELLNGPGKVCAGLGLTKDQNRLDLLGDSLYLSEGAGEPFSIRTDKRVGIDYAGGDADLPYRFILTKL